MENRRITAKKVRIADIINGQYVKKDPGSFIISGSGEQLARVRVLGTVVDKFISPDSRYATITLDDGTETIRCKSFINVKIFEKAAVGGVVDAFGKVKEYNGERYIAVEIVRPASAGFEMLRALELKKAALKQANAVQSKAELKSKILKLIEELDGGEGTDYQKLIKESGLAEESVDGAVAELLESGICFEPRPGKIKRVS